jgi:hypothetical protein
MNKSTDLMYQKIKEIIPNMVIEPLENEVDLASFISKTLMRSV